MLHIFEANQIVFMLAKPTGGVGTTAPGGQAERIAEGSPAGVGRRWRRRRRRRRGRGRGRRRHIMSSVRREPCLSPQALVALYQSFKTMAEGPRPPFKPFGSHLPMVRKHLRGRCSISNHLEALADVFITS